MIRLAVAGCTGKMGCAIVREIAKSDTVELVCAITRSGNQYVGIDMGKLAEVGVLNVPITCDTQDAMFDVMIDFSSPDGLARNLQACRQFSTAILLGTTGLNEFHNTMLVEASRDIAVLFAPNTSVGVNLCAILVELAARVLGESTDIEIVEAHHKNKVDAPSGTALFLAESATQGMQQDLYSKAVFSREGQVGIRPQGSIGFSSIRGGNIVGEHTVMFIGENERVEITHKVTDRQIFAQGAVQAAQWLSQRERGLYSMSDMLELPSQIT